MVPTVLLFRRPTSSHRCSSWKIALNEWCLVVTVQTAVEVPQLLGVPVEIPQVQFLDKFDTTVLQNDYPGCAGVGVMRHASHLFFDKVVDVPVVRRCSSSSNALSSVPLELAKPR